MGFDAPYGVTKSRMAREATNPYKASAHDKWLKNHGGKPSNDHTRRAGERVRCNDRKMLANPYRSCYVGGATQKTLNAEATLPPGVTGGL